MKKIIYVCVTLVLTIFLTGCGSNIKEISYSELEKKLENKETFILEVAQDGCHNCEEFNPKFNKILLSYNLTAYTINKTNLTEEENNKLTNLYNVTGTPTVIFINKGEEISIQRRIIGNVEKDKVISKLKTAGFIK